MIHDVVDRLRLVRSAGIGPVTYRQLIARFGSPAAALAAVPDLARRGGGKAPSLHSCDDAEREIAKVEKLGAARVRPRRPPRPSRRREGQLARRLTEGIREPHLYAYA